jgi:hypothetical protein
MLFIKSVCACAPLRSPVLWLRWLCCASPPCSGGVPTTAALCRAVEGGGEFKGGSAVPPLRRRSRGEEVEIEEEVEELVGVERISLLVVALIFGINFSIILVKYSIFSLSCNK